MRERIYLVLGLLLWTSAEAQTHTPNATKGPPSAPLPVFEITLSKDPDYPALPWAWTTQREAVEADCGSDGNVYVSVDRNGLVALTPNGVVSFLNGKMTDIPHPFYRFGGVVNPSKWGSGVAFEVSGFDDAKVEITPWTDEEGRVQTETDITDAIAGNYIARFDKDGTYKGAIAIDDLPFKIDKFAIFDSGNIIAQGLDRNRVPQIALLDSSAKILRYLYLRKDISTSKNVAEDNLDCTGCTAMVDEVVSFSYFMPWQGRVLLWRRYTSIPRIYEVQESGQARVVNIKAPEGYDIGSLIRTDRTWFVSFNKPDAKGNRPDAFDSLLEINPQTGKPLGEYRMKPPDQMPETVISCFFDGEFWGVRQDAKEQKLEVVRGTAAPYRGK